MLLIPKKNYCNIYKSSNYCIKSYNFPVMKRKSFCPLHYKRENVIDALKYIEKYIDYDINLILQDAKRAYDFSYNRESIINFPDLPSYEYKLPVMKTGSQEIIKFLNTNPKVYIYGTGIIARKILGLYYPYFQHVKGFVVSDDQYVNVNKFKGFEVLHVSKIEYAEASVLVALNTEHSQAVKSNLKKCKKVLFLW